MKQKKYEISLWLVAIIWGINYVAVSAVLQSGFSTLLTISLRFCFAGLVFFIIGFKEIKKLTKKETVNGIIGGIFLFLAFILQTTGLQLSTPANNAFITAGGVVFVPFVSRLFFKKNVQTKTYFAAALCLFGILLLNFSPGMGFQLAIGDLLSLGGAFFFGLQIAYVSEMMNDIDVLQSSFLQFTTVGVLALISMFIFAPNSFALADFQKGILPLAFSAIFSTTLAYFLQFWALRKVAATKATMITCTESVFGAIVSVCIGFEPFRLNMLLGGGIMIFAILFLDIDFKTLLKKKQPEELAIPSEKDQSVR